MPTRLRHRSGVECRVVDMWEKVLGCPRIFREVAYDCAEHGRSGDARTVVDVSRIVSARL